MSATNDRETPALDPAQQSLADALRVSFTILKFVMIAVLIAYGASGIFSVGSNEVALRLRFGDYVGAPGERVLERGTYFAAPFPIEQVIKIDTRPVSLNLAEAFWYEAGGNDRGRTRDQIRNSRAGPLDPVRDGSLLTGDMNIVHTRWTVTFQITEPVAYITNVGETDLAEEIVRCAVSQAIVQTVAQLPADEILKGVVNRETATLTAQRQLDEMAAGLTIAQLALDQVTAPNSVMGSFDAVTTAETERSRQIVESQQDRARILGETAGEASGNLLALLDRYERARETTAADADAVAEAINRVFDELRIDNVAIGGEVAEVMNAARTYRTQVVERLKGDRDIFERLLPQFLRNPRIILTRLWEDAKERILTGDVETFYTLPGKLELQLNRDPEIQQARQRQQLQGLKERQAEFDR
ncbi:MAG: SPFH domain-containing protein [Planctomycetota bacterium]|nr:SPFH domain-containing protein [Planctomycetota bacterium]